MDNYDEPKKSGTVLKVILIIITVIAVVAAAALGLLYYNATDTLSLIRDKNAALSETNEEYKAKVAAMEQSVADYEAQIADLTAQLEEAQKAAAAKPPVVDEEENGEEGETPKTGIDLSGNKDLSVKPDTLFDEGVEYKVDVAGLNMRSGPNTTYKILTSVALNATVTAWAEDGDWLLVTSDGTTFGWVKASFVSEK